MELSNDYLYEVFDGKEKIIASPSYSMIKYNIQNGDKSQLMWEGYDANGTTRYLNNQIWAMTGRRIKIIKGYSVPKVALISTRLVNRDIAARFYNELDFEGYETKKGSED